MIYALCIKKDGIAMFLEGVCLLYVELTILYCILQKTPGSRAVQSVDSHQAQGGTSSSSTPCEVWLVDGLSSLTWPKSGGLDSGAG